MHASTSWMFQLMLSCYTRLLRKKLVLHYDYNMWNMQVYMTRLLGDMTSH